MSKDIGPCPCDINPFVCDHLCCCDKECPLKTIEEWKADPNNICIDNSKKI